MERTKATLPATERLAGIEYMRGFAAYAVICIHSGLAVHNHTTDGAGVLRESFDFAVPFFLVLSFFFALRGEGGWRLSWGDWWRKRASRLVLPFVFWSAVYLALHVVKMMAQHQTDSIVALLSDPADLILSGGTSVALYFLPLLLIGLFLVHLVGGALKRLPVWALALGFVAALVFVEFCEHATFIHETTRPDLVDSPLRLLQGLVLFAIRCVPLILGAALLARVVPSPSGRNAFPFLVVGVVLLVLPHWAELPKSSLDSVLGIGAFLLAWGFSGLAPVSSWATLVGLYSFGVYLVHQIFLEMIQVTVPYHGTMGVVGTLVLSAVVYVVSMLTVGWASRGGPLVRRIFGLR